MGVRVISATPAQKRYSHFLDKMYVESARKKFLMNSTYIMSRKWESNVFGLRRTK